MNNKFREWHKYVSKRYNQLVQIIISNRGISKRKELENELKSIYAKLCGKGKGIYDGDEETQDIDSDGEDGDIEEFDNFAEYININNVSQIEYI